MQSWFGDSQSLTEITQPRFDISETDTEVEVKTDVPGFKAEEIDIEVRDEVLTIRGEQSEEKKSSDEGTSDDKRTYHRVERRTGSFSRSVWLPCPVNTEGIEAELQDGVLTVALPKSKAAKACKVKVKS